MGERSILDRKTNVHYENAVPGKITTAWVATSFLSEGSPAVWTIASASFKMIRSSLYVRHSAVSHTMRKKRYRWRARSSIHKRNPDHLFIQLYAPPHRFILITSTDPILMYERLPILLLNMVTTQPSSSQCCINPGAVGIIVSLLFQSVKMARGPKKHLERMNASKRCWTRPDQVNFAPRTSMDPHKLVIFFRI
nr:uncharacterized protein LOC115267048 [Aedes albopictus]